MTPADLALAAAYPGDSGARQPVHTVYVPADRVRPGLTTEYGAAARAALDEHAPDAETLARVVGADPESVSDVWTSLLTKLEHEPVEDLRIDLEDGYRGHSDDEEDADAVAAVRAARRRATAVLGGALQELRVHHARPRSAHPRPRARRRARVRSAVRRLPADLAQGDLGRAGGGDGGGLRPAGDGVRAGGGATALRGPGRDAAGDPRPGRDGDGRAPGARGAGTLRRAALRDLRLHGRPGHRGAPNRPWTTRSPTTRRT